MILPERRLKTEAFSGYFYKTADGYFNLFLTLPQFIFALC